MTDSAPQFVMPLPVEVGTESKEPDVPRLEAYLVPTPRPIGGVLIAPGGGYSLRAPHEAAEVAAAFNAAGFHSFVLHYRVKPARHPLPLQDAVNAIRTIRSKAVAWHVAPNRVAVCGFSAGGHLAGSLALAYDDPSLLSPDDAPSARPDAAVLCYAVISSGPFGHRGSFDRLFGRDAPVEQREVLSLEKRVRRDSPPFFIWHTSDDASVPVENALHLAEAIRRAGRPFELHVYPHGRHGLGLARPEQDLSPRVAAWFALCTGWLRELGWPVADDEAT